LGNERRKIRCSHNGDREDSIPLEDDTVWTGTVTYRYQHLGAPCCLLPQLAKKSTRRVVGQDYPTDGNGQIPRDTGNYTVPSLSFRVDFFKTKELERSIGQPTKYYQPTSVHTPSFVCGSSDSKRGFGKEKVVCTFCSTLLDT